MAVRVGGIEFAIRVNAKDAVSAVRRFQGAVGGAGASASQFSTAVSGASRALLGAAAGLAAMSAAATVAANRLLAVAQSSTLLAARVQVLGTVFQQVGQNVGFTSAQLNSVEESVKSLGITTQAARRSLTQLLQANLDLTKATRLTRIAQDAAVIAGVDSSEAFNRLVVSIQRNDVRLLRNLGIVINLNTVYQKFAAQTGRTVNTLTAFEKRQLLLNEVLIRGADIAGTYEAAMGDVFKRFTSLNRKFEEASRVFGEQFLPVFGLVVDTTDQLLDAFTKGDFASEFQSLAAAAAVALPVFAALTGAAAALVAALAGVGFLIAGAVAAPAFAVVTAAAAGLAVTLGALAAAATAVAGAVAFAIFRTREFAESVEMAGAAGEKFGQDIFDIQASVRVIDNLAKAGDRSAASLGILSQEVEKVATAAPELAVALREAADAGDFERVLDIIGNKIPEASLSAAQTVALGQAQQQGAIDQARQALLDYGLSLEEANVIIDESIRTTGGLANVTSMLAEEIDPLNGALGGVNSGMIAFNISTTDAGESLQAAAEQFERATRSLEAFGEAAAAAELQRLQAQIDETRKAGDQSIRALQALQNEQKKFFSDNEKELARFLELQSKVSTQGLTSAEQVRRATELQIVVERKRAAEALEASLKVAETKLTEAGRVKAINKARAENEKTLAASLSRVRKEEADALAALAEQERFFAETIAFGTEQLAESNRALDERARRLDLLASGIEPNLLRIQERRARAAAENERAEERLTQRLVELQAQRGVRLIRLNAELVGGLISQDEVFADRTLQNVNDTINQVRERLKIANRQRILDDREFAMQIERERKKQFDSIFREEEDLLEKLAGLRGEVNLNSLNEVRKLADEQKKALEDTEDFITRISRGLENKATPGISAVRGAFDEFSEAIARAGSEDQLNRLQKLFPKEVEQRIKNATKELENAQNKLKEFREETRPGKEREQRIARQKRFNQLVDAGVPLSVAQAERDKQRVKDADSLNAQEEKLKKEKEEQQRIARELKTIQEEQAKTVQTEIDARRVALSETVDFEARRLELQKMQTAELEKQLGVVRQQRADLAGATGVPVPAGAMVPTAQTPQAVQLGALGRSLETPAPTPRGAQTIDQLIASIREEQEARGETDRGMQRIFELSQRNAERERQRAERVARQLDQIRRDKETGDQVLTGGRL